MWQCNRMWSSILTEPEIPEKSYWTLSRGSLYRSVIQVVASRGVIGSRAVYSPRLVRLSPFTARAVRYRLMSTCTHRYPRFRGRSSRAHSTQLTRTTWFSARTPNHAATPTTLSTWFSYLMIFSYSLSLPLESRQRLYITEASTLAGLYVLGSFSNEITDKRMVLIRETRAINRLEFDSGEWIRRMSRTNREYRATHLTFCVGFHLSQGSSPLCGSSTGGCRIDIHRSPFCTDKERRCFRFARIF